MTFAKTHYIISTSDSSVEIVEDVSLMVMSRTEFENFLTPEHRRFIVDCIKRGLDDYDNPSYYAAEARRDHTPGVRAAIRNCHIIAHAQRALSDMSDLRVYNRNNRVLFVIADRVRVSFKRFDKDLRSRNYPTRQAVNYNKQTLFDADMPGEVTNIIAGYQHNGAETEYELYITCPIDKRNMWELQLSGNEILGLLSPEVESNTDQLVEKVRQKRVRVRKDVARKDVANE